MTFGREARILVRLKNYITSDMEIIRIVKAATSKET